MSHIHTVFQSNYTLGRAAVSSCPFVHHSCSTFCLFDHVWSSPCNLLPTHWTSFCWPHARHWHRSTYVQPRWAFVPCWGSKDCLGRARSARAGFRLAWETKLLNPCLSTELNSSRTLRPQGSCSSSGSCQGQVSQPNMKHARCLRSALLSERANWSRGSIAARRKRCHNSPLRDGFRQASDKSWLLPFLKHVSL